MDTIVMTRLLIYHTTMANPDYYWENNAVAVKLKRGEITTYEEYEKACKSAGCLCYSQEVFDQHIAGIEFK